MLNDSYLDPPEPEEGPECDECDDGFGEYSKDVEKGHLYICDSCGAKIIMGFDDFYCPPEAMDKYFKDADKEDEVKWTMKYSCDATICPHGNTWGECGTCDHLGDMAYDAARESRR